MTFNAVDRAIIRAWSMQPKMVKNGTKIINPDKARNLFRYCLKVENERLRNANRAIKQSRDPV